MAWRGRAAAPAPRPTSPRASPCRSCWSSTCRLRRNPRRRWCADSCRTIQPSASRASCSTASAATAIAPWWPMRSRSWAFASSARCRARTISFCPSGTSALSRRASMATCDRGALASAQRFQQGLARFAHTRPVHGECGGYMVLGEGIEDADGARHAMTGLLAHSTSFAKRKLHLGYREARLLCDSPLGSATTTLRGHEFHYAALIASGSDDPLADLADGQGRPLGKSGARRGRVTGTFFHAIAQAQPT